ncbi:S9 family peptidase [Ferdinandcohnia sp. Marseille-Q9671]
MLSFPKANIESYFRTLNITDFDVHPNEDELVFSTNINGYYNLWGMKLNHPYPYQLTTVNQTISFVKYDPNGDFLLLGHDLDGDEDNRIFALPPTGGETTPLLQKEGEKYYYGDLSKDGKTLYYITSLDNPSFLNIGRYGLESGENEVLIRGESGPSYLFSVSPDESSLAYSKEIGNSSVFGYVLKAEESIPVTPSQEIPHAVHQVEYLDNDTLLLVTNYQSEFSYIAKFQISTRSFEKVVEINDYELGELTIDNDRNQLFFVASRGVVDKLYTFEMTSGSLTLLETPFDIVDKVVVGKKGTLFALGRSATQPANLFFSPDGGSWKQLTRHQLIGVGDERLMEPNVLTYSSYDGIEIEALYFAANPECDNGHTILWPHGGPQHAVRNNFSPLFQYLSGQGYRVFAPNFRGSTGYGDSFMKLVNKDWGGGPRLDIIAGMDWLDQQGKSQADKWFCIGGSYGGYMTLLLHGRHADRFKAFVDIFGPSNLFTTIETAPEHWKAADRELIGDAVEDREKLIEDSPMTYIDQMTKPMLVIQGKNDPRVVKVESDVIVEAMAQRGQDVEYIVLEDEGHGFTKTENALKVYRKIMEFLEKYV